MLVLSIMFIITMPLLTHSISLTMPGNGGLPAPQIINLQIEFDSAVLWHRELNRLRVGPEA